MDVTRIMTTDVKVCGAEDTLEEAARMMWEGDCGCVPVLDGDRRVIGMLTDRDVSMSAYFEGRPLRHILVARAMAKEVFACRVGDDTQDVAKLMRERQVRRLPVLDAGGHLAGLISLHDLACEAVRETPRKVRAISAEEVELTLASISRARKPRPATANPAV